MTDTTADETSLADQVSAVVGIDPNRLDGFAFASRILTCFRLIRALFSTNELDTCLKLMLLFELTRIKGRFSIDEIRGVCRFLEADKVEGLARSLREAGWLDLREGDRTYSLSPMGLHLLTILHASDLSTLSPANALARAAQGAAFGLTLDGAGPGQSEFLLSQLLVLLENQVDEARGILQQGRPRHLIDWSQRDHGRQVETIQQVLSTIEEKLEPARQFDSVVRLHESMQAIVRLHSSIDSRLRHWNLDRLYTAGAGYSIPQLLEAVLGTSDESLSRALDDGLLRPPTSPPSLTWAELISRIHGARRKLASQAVAYVYADPEPVISEEWNPSRMDPAAEFRAHLTSLFAERTVDDGSLEVDVWRREAAFAPTIWDVALLCGLHGEGDVIMLDDTRRARVEFAMPIPTDVPLPDLLEWLESRGGLQRLPDGLFARVRIRLEP